MRAISDNQPEVDPPEEMRVRQGRASSGNESSLPKVEGIDDYGREMIMAGGGEHHGGGWVARGKRDKNQLQWTNIIYFTNVE